MASMEKGKYPVQDSMLSFRIVMFSDSRAPISSPNSWVVHPHTQDTVIMKMRVKRILREDTVKQEMVKCGTD